MPTSKVKEQARRVVETLPEEATWDDLMYELYVRQKISMGLEAAEQGRVISHEAVKRQLPV
jgi:predicted transcriptional regulator